LAKTTIIHTPHWLEHIVKEDNAESYLNLCNNFLKKTTKTHFLIASR
jgi:hypothetical protein